jgi:DNA repair protein RecO (recombination protein O)
MISSKAEGIVIRTIKYSDSQLIVSLFTKEYGRISTIVNRSRKKGSSNFFQPLFHLGFEMNYSEKKTVQRISQLQFKKPYQSIPFSITKNTIAQFLAEVLNKVIPENEPDNELYSYLTNAFHLFDEVNENTQSFHLVFLLHLTRFLGFYPGRKNVNNRFFSPSEGTYVSKIMHDTIPDALSEQFDKLANTPVSLFYEINLKKDTQSALLSHLIDFYKVQMNVGDLKSYNILKQVFSQ